MNRILVAGIGNIFLGDDGFGVAVVQRLLRRRQRDGVRVVDFGIRSFDLVYALLDGYEVTIFVDATTRGGLPGTVYTIEPNLDESENEPLEMEAHVMNPARVVRVVKAMGGNFGRTLLIGCEPETLGPEEGAMGLSGPVEAAVERTVDLVEALVARLLDETPSPVGAVG